MTIGSLTNMKPTLMVCKQSIWPQLLPDQRFLAQKMGWAKPLASFFEISECKYLVHACSNAGKVS